MVPKLVRGITPQYQVSPDQEASYTDFTMVKAKGSAS
jgi:hypothetical protein